jgi:hypothetical protein
MTSPQSAGPSVPPSSDGQPFVAVTPEVDSLSDDPLRQQMLDAIPFPGERNTLLSNLTEFTPMPVRGDHDSREPLVTMKVVLVDCLIYRGLP